MRALSVPMKLAQMGRRGRAIFHVTVLFERNDSQVSLLARPHSPNSPHSLHDPGLSTPWPALRFQINILPSGMAAQPSSLDNTTNRFASAP